MIDGQSEGSSLKYVGLSLMTAFVNFCVIHKVHTELSPTHTVLDVASPYWI